MLQASKKARKQGREVRVPPQVIAVYSETGGATKTTTALSLGVCAAQKGIRTIIADLDPRAALTKWTGVQPQDEWRHVGAILGDPEPDGWLDELAIPVPWDEVPNLRVVPSARAVSNREKTNEEYADTRLQRSLDGTTAELVILDMPNRQGGPIVQNALTAATEVLYAAKPDEDGLDGVDGAALSVRRYREHRQQLGAPVNLTEAGIVVGQVRETVMSLDSRRAIDVLRDNYGALVLDPFIPERVIVREARAAGDYYGLKYEKGRPVHAAYTAIADQVIK